MTNLRDALATINTTGSAGSASGTGISESFNGFVLGIYLDFGAAPATTDVTITETLTGVVMLALTNVNTDGLYVPMQPTVTPANALTGVWNYFPVNGSVTVAVAQCDQLTPALTVRIRYLPG
jgi:hypothetical protein